MRLVDRLHEETSAFHADADDEAVKLLGPVSPADYWAFLCRTYGFVFPVERSLESVPALSRYIDVRRFRKHELLRRDLLSFGMTVEQLEQLRQCTVPLFDSAEESFGWAYLIERSTLGHHNLFRHLGTLLPGDVAFTSSYLKCYFGSVGDMWRGFGRALDLLPETSAQRVIDAAKLAFTTFRSWRHHQDHGRFPSDSGAGQQQIL